MKAIRLLAILCVLAAMLCACKKNQPQQTLPQVYTVTVVDTQGTPIPGVMVQLCLDVCYPGATGSDGRVEFPVPAADYKVSLLALPEGYDYSGEMREFSFDDGSFALTITLQAE
jgi:hypothetical protein